MNCQMSAKICQEVTKTGLKGSALGSQQKITIKKIYPYKQLKYPKWYVTMARQSLALEVSPPRCLDTITMFTSSFNCAAPFS